MEEIRAILAGFRTAFRSMDEVDLGVIFRRRGVVMKSVPQCLKGPFRNAMKVVLEEIIAGSDHHDIRREERAWKAFLLLPRLLLHKRCRGEKIGKEKFTERFQNFRAGRWDGLLAASIAHDEEASSLASRKRRTQNHNDLEHRVNRAMTRIQLGELSVGRMALERADLAPGTEATLTQLRRRLARPQDPLPPEIHFDFRSSRRGTAGAPSGMTNEHLRPLLDNPQELHLFFRVAELLARGQVPENGASVLRKGRMTALQKPGGGVRVVARTISQQLAKVVESATAPFQYALSTRAGCECVAHALQAMTDLDPEATILSIDGVSAYDLISRRAMLFGSCRVEGGSQVLLFVKLF